MRFLRALFYAGLLALALWLLLMLYWSAAAPTSTLMLARYFKNEPVVRIYVPLSRISDSLVGAVAISEDARFCAHSGVDWDAIKEVMEDADEEGPARGASTLSMQVAKNLFLWPSRSMVRKGLEIALAQMIEWVWSKRRILEVYLNIAEWGPDGIFGVEAAAQKFFGKPASRLTPHEAALLARALPNPILRNPSRPGPGLARLARRLEGRLAEADAALGCIRKGAPNLPHPHEE